MSNPMTHVRQFASDTYAGICPEALAALQEANHGHISSYGDDAWTQRASDAFRHPGADGIPQFRRTRRWLRCQWLD